MFDWIRRWLDGWRHPAEYPRQRVRRRYLEGLQLAERERARPDYDAEVGQRG